MLLVSNDAGVERDSLRERCLLTFDLTARRKVNFGALSQIGSEGKLQAEVWKDAKICEAKLRKSVQVILPISTFAAEVLHQEQGSALISLRLANETGAVDYADNSLPNSDRRTAKGMKIVIEDIQCDIKKSHIKGLYDGRVLV